MDKVISQSLMPLKLLLMLHNSLTLLSQSTTHLSHMQPSLSIMHHNLTEPNLSISSLMVVSLSMLRPTLMVPISLMASPSLTDISPTELSLYTLHPTHTAPLNPMLLINLTECSQSKGIRRLMEFIREMIKVKESLVHSLKLMVVSLTAAGKINKLNMSLMMFIRPSTRPIQRKPSLKLRHLL